MRKGIGFDPNPFQPLHLRLNNRSACAAKGIENCGPICQAKVVDVISNQVRRKRKNKTIPIVNGTILLRN